MEWERRIGSSTQAPEYHSLPVARAAESATFLACGPSSSSDIRTSAADVRAKKVALTGGHETTPHTH